LLTGLRIAGAPQNVSALGETEVRIADLPASANQLQIDFVGLGFGSGESLRYQYRLEGADSDWSAPTAQRTVTYARLASGRYRFLVRALSADGQVSANPAVITFRVLPPLWARWWFVAIVILAVMASAYALYRYRVARLWEVANMRTRIATDLHDDIGANLTRISILSEVAKQQFGNGNESRNPLTSIAEIARESVASMSDIVWAIDPERDSLRDLTRKMRQHADEVFTLRDIDLEFNAPPSEQDLRLGVNVRRDVLLIFKEAVSNAARHSDCSRVVIDLLANGNNLSLSVADNGRGFDLSSQSDGHGLVNMRRRAEKLNGSFEMESLARQGTRVRIAIPLSRASRVA
jgi:signal transduction histidine kinase